MREPRLPAFASRLALGCVAALCVLCLPGCLAVARRSVYSPVYLRYDELRKGVESTAPAEPSVTGKIYVKDQYVYVNEVSRGIHVIDNSDPANPAIVAFIPIPGSVDMAIRGDTLFADSYVDLVAIDIADPRAAHEVARVENAFPYPDPMGAGIGWYPGSDVFETPDEEIGIVVDWEKTGETLVVYDTRDLYAVDSGGAEGGGDTGTGGSMARITLLGDYLYALHYDSLVLVDVSDPSAPELLPDPVYVGWSIETIFPYGELLFIGSTMGMYIYDASEPPALRQLSRIEHVTSCDPVVVQDDRAYVTLRAGSMCGGGVNQLLIIDVTDPEEPTLIAEHALQGPYGLAVDGTTLFVCDGEYGLKVLDVADPTASPLPEIAAETGYRTYDVILVPPLAIVVGPDGLYQYDTTGLSGATPALELLSHIVVTPPPPEDTEEPTPVPGSPGEETR